MINILRLFFAFMISFLCIVTFNYIYLFHLYDIVMIFSKDCLLCSFLILRLFYSFMMSLYDF